MNPPSAIQGQGRIVAISVNPAGTAAPAEALLATFETGKVRVYA